MRRCPRTGLVVVDKGDGMQAKHIDDEAFLSAVDDCVAAAGRWANVWEVADVLQPLNPGLPENEWLKLIRAKARRLILRGRMDGCWCGCRGDFERKPVLVG